MKSTIFLAIVFLFFFACGGNGGGNDNPPPEDTPIEDPQPDDDPLQNIPPKVNDDNVVTFAGETVTFNPLENDDDVDGEIDSSTLTLFSVPAGHLFEISANGTVSYFPPEKFIGMVQLSYSVGDDDGDTSVANIEITVRLRTISLTARSSVGADFYKNGDNFYHRGGGAGGGRGFNIATFDVVTGKLIKPPKNYDTWGSGSTKGPELADYINHDIPMGAIVLLAVGDSAGSYGEELAQALADLGATQASDIGWRNTWAMIAIKGEGALDEVRSDGHWDVVSATAEIDLELEDSHGDTVDTATQLELNNAVVGYLYQDETDMFWFELQHDGVLTITSSKPDETNLSITNSSGEEIVSSVDFQQFTDKSIKCYLKADIYYLKTESASELALGRFVLRSRFVADPPLPVNLTFTAQSGVVARFAVNGDEFFARGGGSGGGRGFNIAVVDPLTGDILETGINFDTYGRGEAKSNELKSYINGLGDGLMLLLAVGDSAGSSYSTILASTFEALGATQASDIGWRNTWAMIAIKGEGALDEVRSDGHWDIVSAVSTITVPGHDVAGDAPGEAETVGINSVIPGFLHKDDVDWYLLTLEQAEIVTFESKGTVDTLLHLYQIEDATGELTEIASADDGAAGENFLLQENLPAGQYYVEISGHGIAAIGQYDLLVIAPYTLNTPAF